MTLRIEIKKEMAGEFDYRKKLNSREGAGI